MNLVPMIDVLLVTIIFLVVTTTYSKYSELQINLPTAEANKPIDRPDPVEDERLSDIVHHDAVDRWLRDLRSCDRCCPRKGRAQTH